jgi:hypothetical protein
MHWTEGDSGICLTYAKRNVKVEVCLLDGSIPFEESMIITEKVKLLATRTPEKEGSL